MPKHSRNKRRIALESDFISSQKPQNRVEYEKLIDNRRPEVENILIEKSKDFRKFNISVSNAEIIKDKNVISNKSFSQIKNGYHNSPNKDKYISQNKEHIKALAINDQRNLMKMFLTFM